MSIFGDMFDDDASNADVGSLTLSLRNKLVLKIPPHPRLSNRLCGLYNQGATCYLNSLLQTLIMTSEFRESLFQLGEKDLGRLEDKEKPGSRVRVIPLHLQKLFARVLLSDQQGASTAQLTDSFGWTNSEEMQHHDVQELNRILFCAIEDSLVGTPGQSLIKDIYHGTIVNQIICQQCMYVSEREEDFLDLCLALAGIGDLEKSLEKSYRFVECMEGRNQYYCDTCNKLVDAEKGARIRHLPGVLTLSLLRFSFDYQKMERYKETAKFAFPTVLDMSPYCENSVVEGDSVYELFSVVIHSGSTHGGHYHAYLRDVDGLGHWAHPDDEEIRLPADPSSGKVDFIDFETPLELLTALMCQYGSDGVPVDKLCSDLTKQTGMSWNKRFKRQYGPINKFLKKYADIFTHDLATNHVLLKKHPAPPVAMADTMSREPRCSPPSDRGDVSRAKHSAKLLRPADGHSWFDFDDSRVRPITEQYLEKQFQGKESAYMLFYRKRSMKRPPQAYGDPLFAVPEHLVDEVAQENIQLDNERYVYSTKLNTIELEVHFGSQYDSRLGALKPLPDCTPSITVTFDRRKTIAELKSIVSEVGGMLLPADDFVIHHAKELPAGLHLYDCITDDPSQTVLQTKLADRSKIFAWGGKQVGGKVFPIGAEMEPVLLTITHGNTKNFSHGFAKQLHISELRHLITDASGILPENLSLSRVVTKGTTSVLEALLDTDASRTLADLQVVDGDHFIAEDHSVTGNSVAECAMARQSLLISLIVENRCVDPTQSWPVFVVEISKASMVAELKSQIMTQVGIKEIQDGGRLRVDDDHHGLRCPLYEHLMIPEVGLQQGMHIIIEPGQAPTKNQVTLFITHLQPVTKWTDLELIVSKDLTVGACLQLILNNAGLTGDKWHLRKTDWYGEPAQVLDTMDWSLERCRIENGHQLLLVVGLLPPHGFFHLRMWLVDKESVLAWITNSIQGLLLGGGSASLGDAAPSPVRLGELLVSKEMTLEDLKLKVLNMPKIEEVSVPSPNHLRIRVLEQEKPPTVLRVNTNTLQRLKLTSASEVGIQILPHEEDLNQNHILLSVVVWQPGMRVLQRPIDLVWDLTRGGASPAGLRAVIGQMLAIPLERLIMAKYYPEKYEWVVIKNSIGKSKAKKTKINLRHSPFHIKDGDVIGVKDLETDPENHDFMTEEDMKGRQRLLEEAEERQKKREKNRDCADILNVGGPGGTRSIARREVGIKIHVADFR